MNNAFTFKNNSRFFNKALEFLSDTIDLVGHWGRINSKKRSYKKMNIVFNGGKDAFQ